jgi:AraC-like DNA-binding protein
MGKPLEAKIPVGLHEALIELGVSPAAVLVAADLPSRLFELGPRLPVAQYFALWRGIMQVSADANVGLRLAERVRADHTEPLFLAILSARNLAAAIDIIASYKRMLSPETLASSRVDDELALSFTWSPDFGEPPEALVDAELAFVVEVARRCTREIGLAPRRLSLRRARLSPTSQHADFFRCPVVLGAHADGLVFDAQDAHRPFYSNNPQLLEALAPFLAARTPAPSRIDEVRAVIGERLRGQRPTLGTVARELAMSARSLQRLLGEHDTSFRDLLDDVRSQHARGYLRSTTFSDPEIAYLLGFEDPNSFYRAFRAWNGLTPSQFRRQPASS